MQSPNLTAAFPNLQPDDYQVTSPATPRYNCIAWAAGNDDTWWWPPGGFNGYYWAPDVGKDGSIEHKTLAALEGGLYGDVARILKRPRE